MERGGLDLLVQIFGHCWNIFWAHDRTGCFILFQKQINHYLLIPAFPAFVLF